jgi:hypothetical protein
MTSTDRVLGMYLHLARASQLRRQPMVHDRMLVLAGVAAAEMGLADVAAECRQRVLAHNHQHLLRDWPTLDAALADERFQAYVRQLRRRYSPEKAEHLLQSLGVEWVNERAAYYTDQEYATALLAGTPQAPPAPPSLQTRDLDDLEDSRAPAAPWRRVLAMILAMVICAALMVALWLWSRG